MDPFSAMIGGGLSLIGGLFNSSSQQAINAANLQQQTWSAQGGYLPGLRANAEKAGFNPLAVLGSRGPNMAVQVGDNSVGNALQNAGAMISKIDMQKGELELAGMKEDLMHKAAINKQTMIDNAVRQAAWEGIQQGKYIPPGVSEPAEKTTLQGAALKGAEDFVDWAGTNYKRIPEWIRRPQEAWDWRQYIPDFRHTPW